MVAGQRFGLVIAGLGVGLAVMSAPVAAADPVVPVDPAVEAPAPAPAPEPIPAPPAEPVAAITPPDGVPHLPSPNSLPPGTTQQAPAHPNAGLLRDIFNALRNGDVSGRDALMLLGTRPVNPDSLAASKPSNQTGPVAPPGPVVPGAGEAPAAPAPVPAPVAPAP